MVGLPVRKPLQWYMYLSKGVVKALRKEISLPLGLELVTLLSEVLGLSYLSHAVGK